MRKRILDPVRPNAVPSPQNWLDLDSLAEVEITSEDAAAPIESALASDRPSGWRAAGPGAQTIRLLFAEPQPLRRIWLHFVETAHARTQEYVLRWSPDRGQSFHEIVRQQWNFSPGGTTSETEDYQVDLPEVTILELHIIPEIGGGPAVATLAQMRLA